MSRCVQAREEAAGAGGGARRGGARQRQAGRSRATGTSLKRIKASLFIQGHGVHAGTVGHCPSNASCTLPKHLWAIDCPYLSGEDTEAQRGAGTCLRMPC